MHYIKKKYKLTILCCEGLRMILSIFKKFFNLPIDIHTEKRKNSTHLYLNVFISYKKEENRIDKVLLVFCLKVK